LNDDRQDRGSATVVAVAPQRPRLPIDPRIRQRLIDVRREQGRRRLRFVLTLVGILIVAAGGWGITRSPLLAVRHVHVAGTAQTPVAAVRAAAGLVHHRQMVDLDPGAMSRAVGSLPWVNSVKVRRHWPSTVSLTITERRPVASATDRRGGWGLIDASGRVLDVVPNPPAGLPTVGLAAAPGAPGGEVAAPAGEPGTLVSADLASALTVAATLPAALTAQVAAVVADADGQVQLSFKSGALALLGPPDALPDKLTALATMLAKAQVGKAIVDVRVPSAPVLTSPATGQ
jgi:cell division protein FtsQ